MNRHARRRHAAAETGRHRGDYLHEAARLFVRQVPANAAPGLFCVSVAHDDGCPKLAGEGDCTCVADVSIKAWDAADAYDNPARLIVQALRPDWPRSVAVVAAATELSRPLVVKLLDRLADQGAVVRTRRGEYQLPDAGG